MISGQWSTRKRRCLSQHFSVSFKGSLWKSRCPKPFAMAIGNVDFEWHRGCIMTAKADGLWTPSGSVSPEDIRAHAVSSHSLCCHEHHLQTPGHTSVQKGVCVTGSVNRPNRHDAESALAAPLLQDPTRSAGDTSNIIGLESLAQQAHIPPGKLQQLRLDLLALGVVHVRELTARGGLARLDMLAIFATLRAAPPAPSLRCLHGFETRNVATTISGGLLRIPQQASSANQCGGLRGAVDFIRRPKKCLSENARRGFGFGIKLRFAVRPYTEAKKQTQSYEQQPRDTAGMRTRRPGASTIATEVIVRGHTDIQPRPKVHAAVIHDLHIIVRQRQRPIQLHSAPRSASTKSFISVHCVNSVTPIRISSSVAMPPSFVPTACSSFKRYVRPQRRFLRTGS